MAICAALSTSCKLMPNSFNEVGAPLFFAKSYKPCAADAPPKARLIFSMAVGAACELNAIACGKITVCTSACGKLNDPPKV